MSRTFARFERGTPNAHLASWTGCDLFCAIERHSLHHLHTGTFQESPASQMQSQVSSIGPGSRTTHPPCQAPPWPRVASCRFCKTAFRWARPQSYVAELPASRPLLALRPAGQLQQQLRDPALISTVNCNVQPTSLANSRACLKKTQTRTVGAYVCRFDSAAYRNPCYTSRLRTFRCCLLLGPALLASSLAGWLPKTGTSNFPADFLAKAIKSAHLLGRRVATAATVAPASHTRLPIAVIL